MTDKLSFNVNNGEYEGPLDLILHLVSKHQLNIMDINISGLLEQYMEQILYWQENDLEVASEFLEMASRLVHIKTVGLLPRYNEEEDTARAELIGQLLEYQACKRAAMLLAAKNEGFGAFVRPPEEIPADLTYTRRHPVELLTHSYWQAIGKGKRKLPPRSEVFSPLVARPFVSVSSRIVFLLRRFYRSSSAVFTGLFADSKSRSEMVATFLAVLELMKAKRLTVSAEEGTAVFLGREEAERRKAERGGHK